MTALDKALDRVEEGLGNKVRREAEGELARFKAHATDPAARCALLATGGAQYLAVWDEENPTRDAQFVLAFGLGALEREAEDSTCRR